MAGSVITSVEDVINLTLVRIGFKDRVGSIWEGSVAAKACLDIYGQTRDELLRGGNWGFAERNVKMTLLKYAPAAGYFPPNQWNPTVNPPIPWLYEYAYPDDCLEVRAVKPAPLFTFNFDPRPHLVGVENDNNYDPPQKVILCNVPDALLVYTGRVTVPTNWEADFVEALAAALGQRLAPTLVGMDAAKFEAADSQASTAVAENTQG